MRWTSITKNDEGFFSLFSLSISRRLTWSRTVKVEEIEQGLNVGHDKKRCLVCWNSLSHDVRYPYAQVLLSRPPHGLLDRQQRTRLVSLASVTAYVWVIITPKFYSPQMVGVLFHHYLWTFFAFNRRFFERIEQFLTASSSTPPNWFPESPITPDAIQIHGCHHRNSGYIEVQNFTGLSKFCLSKDFIPISR
jgi:hypothetical protein